MKAVYKSMIILLIFSSLSQSMVVAKINSSPDSNVNISVDEGATLQESIISVVTQNEWLENLEISLPNKSNVNLKKTIEFSSPDILITYDQERNKLIVNRQSLQENTKVKVVLQDLISTENKIVVKGFQNKEIISNDTFSFRVIDTGQKESDTKIQVTENTNNEVNASEKEAANIKHNISTSTIESSGMEEKSESTVKEKNISTDVDQENIFTPFSGNLNVDIDLSPKKATVLSGNVATYTLTLKFTGSTIEYTNADIVVHLPITNFTEFQQNLDELMISGIIPSYDETNHTLTYHFDKLKTGSSYETDIVVNTINGVSPTGAELTATATFSADQQPNISDDAMVSVNTSSPFDVSKTFLDVIDNDKNLASPGSTTLWEIKLDIPKHNEGQLYIKEGSKIVVTDALPNGLTYVSTEKGPEPIQQGDELIWEFDAPSISEQEGASTELFSTTIQVLLKVEEEGTVDTTQTNNVTANLTYFDETKESATGFDSIHIVDSDTANGDIEGNYYVPTHIGPADGNGKTGTAQIKNPNPIVYHDAYLAFKHGIAPLPESQYGDFINYTTSYVIDPNLIFQELRTPSRFIYRPNVTYPNDVPLERDPEFNIVATVNGSEVILVKNAETNRTYTRAELGLAENDKVGEIKYDFTYAPSGMLNVGNPTYYFEVVDGYIGEVRNTFNVYGVAGNGDAFDKNYNKDPLNSIAGPRTAQITNQPTEPPPTAYVGIALLDHEGGEISIGQNRMKINLNNIDSSSFAMKGPLEATVLLPLGVTLSDSPNSEYIDGHGRSSLTSSSAAGGNYEILSDDYNGSGRQLVKINWNDNYLRIGDGLIAEFDVDVAETAPNVLVFDVYGFSGEPFLQVPDSHGSAITDTTLQTDEEDLNNNGITNEPRLKSGNEYTIRGVYNIQTEKLIKGELDDDYTYFGQTVPGGSIDYQFKITNTTGDTISNMTLIDVLPSVGDLGITDNVNRGSQFTPIMTNSILLPTEWQDKVNVFYSKAKNPERDELTENTDYPDTSTKLTNPAGAEDPNWITESEVTDWSTIHSFKIELKEDVEWIVGQDITINFSMQAPEATEVKRELLDETIDPESRAAWNSFAIATDHGQPVEPARVGVYMNYDIEDPTINKTINDQKDPVELKNRDELFTWKVENSFGNYTTNWETVVISDQIHELLNVESVYVIDQNGNDVTGNGSLDISDDNLITFTLNKKDESFAYLKDQTYTLVMESTIRETATEEELAPFIEGTGIPNTAQLIIDDDPTTSNEVEIKPPVIGEIQITKVDEQTREILEGAVFELRKCNDESASLKDCEIVRNGTTDENGSLQFTDLQKGTYKLVEVSAPDGYRITTKTIDVEITNVSRSIELEIENEKSDWQLPQTGGIGTMLFYILGGVLMIGALFLLVKNRRELK